MAYTTIDDPSAHHQSVLWTGNGGTQAITFGGNSDLQPDLLWTKNRNDTHDPIIRDTSRGISERLLTHATDAAGGATGTTAFGSDGFTLDSTVTVNSNSNTFVAWGWKANGGTTSSNTDGNVTVTLQANTTAGFSIGTWTSNGNTNGTIGHGLGARPDIVITKERNDTGNWNVLIPEYASNEMAFLQSTNGFSAASGINTVGSSTFKDGDGADGNTRVFYAFRSIKGYSKIGKYKGNGAEPGGPFIFTGFKPAWFIIHGASENGQAWFIGDNKRSPINPCLAKLGSNVTAAESATAGDNNWDFLSNGFKIKTQDDGLNKNGVTYIYMAFAENPFVSSEGIPTTAR